MPPQSVGSLLASPLQRIGAALIDLAVLFVADLLLFFILLSVLPPDDVDRALLVLATCCSLAYLIVLWGTGQTLGKRILAIKVVGPDGRRPGVRRGALRLAGYVIASLPFKIGLLPILWDPLRRGWHDQIAGTLVVKEDAAGSAGWPFRTPKGPFRVPEGRTAPPPTDQITLGDSAPGSLRWQDLAMLPVFAVATALLTWPVAARLPAHFPSDGGDANLFVWNLWWARTAALDPRLSMLETAYISWPEKISLQLHSFSLFNCALGIPLQSFLSPTLTYSVLLLLALCLTAFAAYLLGKYITGSAAGGLLVGLFVGFSPYMIWHAHGHLDLVSSEWIVLYVLLTVILLKKAQARHALFAALAFALAGLCAWHQLTHAAVFTAVFAAAWLFVHRTGIARRVLLIGVAGALGLALLAVWLVPMERDFTSGRYVHERLVARARAEMVSLDAAALMVPPAYHPVFGRWTAPTYYGGMRNRIGTEQAGYPGWSLLALVLVAMWEPRRRRTHLPWLATSVAFALLSFGFTFTAFGRSGFPLWLLLLIGGPPGSGLELPIVPSLAVRAAMVAASGSPYLLRSPTVVDMPFSLLWTIGGVMRLASTPARFAQIANLCLAVLAAMGALHLARLASARRGKWAGGAVLAIASAAVMFEYMIVPRFPTEPSAIHPFYYRLARERRCAAILEVPVNLQGDSRFQRAQTVHGKRLYIGCMSRRPDNADDFLAAHPLLSEALAPTAGDSRSGCRLGLSALRGRAFSGPLLSIYRSDLRALVQTRCCCIVLHKRQIQPDSLRLAEQLLGGKLGLPVAFNDGQLLVYRLPSLEAVAAAPPPASLASRP